VRYLTLHHVQKFILNGCIGTIQAILRLAQLERFRFDGFSAQNPLTNQRFLVSNTA